MTSSQAFLRAGRISPPSGCFCKDNAKHPANNRTHLLSYAASNWARLALSSQVKRGLSQYQSMMFKTRVIKDSLHIWGQCTFEKQVGLLLDKKKIKNAVLNIDWHVKPPVHSETAWNLYCTFLKVNLHVLWNEMSQTSQAKPTNLTEGYHVTNLTVVVLLLIPCVVVLLLLNCFFLGYKLLIMSKTRHKREDTEEILLQSTLQRVRRVSDVVFSPLQDRRAYMSLSEPVLPHPVTSSRASSRERAGVEHRIRLLRPDGATGSGSLRAPSTIRATSSAAGFSPRLELPSGFRTYSVRKADWCKSAPVLPQSSDSEPDTRVNLVPPNSPMVSGHWVNWSCFSSSLCNYMARFIWFGAPWGKMSCWAP